VPARPKTDRLAALEARIARLERDRAAPRGAAAPPVRDPRRYWQLEGLRARAATPSRQSGGRGRPVGGGRIGFAGLVDTGDGRHYEWQGEQPVASMLDQDWGAFASGFAALGHRVRLELLRALLRGTHEVGRLQRLPGLGTSGQLYHHLRQLQAAGWIRQLQRNHYVVVPDRIVAVLVMLTTASLPEAPPPVRRGSAS